jgi:hypothetical protein
VNGDAGGVRRALNLATMKELQLPFNRGGRKAIDKVMRQQPAMFLKMLVLLVPRELEVSHSGTIKAMSDEQIEEAIEAIQAMLDRRQGDGAKVIDARAEPAAALPAPRRRKRTVKETMPGPASSDAVSG